MKAKQLMLGNYALYNGLTVRVRNIHDNVFLDGGDESVEVVYDDGVVVLVDPCSLEPIPLTPEILEKNGFKAELGPGGRFVLEINGLCVTVQFSAIDYVHELQNALLLCGIEKEIEL